MAKWNLLKSKIEKCKLEKTRQIKKGYNKTRRKERKSKKKKVHV